MVKAAWFRNYAPSERPEKFDRIVQSWDTANKASELSDFSVCTTWGIKGKDLYLLHVLRKRMEYPELKRAVREQCEAFDDKASGTRTKPFSIIAVWACMRMTLSDCGW